MLPSCFMYALYTSRACIFLLCFQFWRVHVVISAFMFRLDTRSGIENALARLTQPAGLGFENTSINLSGVDSTTTGALLNQGANLDSFGRMRAKRASDTQQSSEINKHPRVRQGPIRGGRSGEGAVQFFDDGAGGIDRSDGRASVCSSDIGEAAECADAAAGSAPWDMSAHITAHLHAVEAVSSAAKAAQCAFISGVTRLARLDCCPKCHGPLGDLRMEMVTLVTFTFSETTPAIPVYLCKGACGVVHCNPLSVGFWTGSMGKGLHIDTASCDKREVWFHVPLVEALVRLQFLAPRLSVKAYATMLMDLSSGLHLSVGKVEVRLGDAADMWRALRRALQRARTLGVEGYPLEKGLLGVCPTRCGLAGPGCPLISAQVDGVLGVTRYSRNPGPNGPGLISERVVPVDQSRGASLFRPGLEDGLMGDGPFDMGALRSSRESCAEIEKVTGVAARRRPHLVVVPSTCSDWKAAVAERTAPREGAVRDEMGFFGMFCSHDFLIHGQIMYSAERYSYAIAALLAVAAIHKCMVRACRRSPRRYAVHIARAGFIALVIVFIRTSMQRARAVHAVVRGPLQVQNFRYDINCQWKPHMMLFLSALRDDNPGLGWLVDLLKDMNCPNPVFHSSGHSASCQARAP